MVRDGLLSSLMDDGYYPRVGAKQFFLNVADAWLTYLYVTARDAVKLAVRLLFILAVATALRAGPEGRGGPRCGQGLGQSVWFSTWRRFPFP